MCCLVEGIGGCCRRKASNVLMPSTALLIRFLPRVVASNLNILYLVGRAMNQIESIMVSQKMRKAWRTWKSHQQGLAQASYVVRRDLHFSMASRHLRIWIEAWTYRARRRTAVEQDASRRGQHAIKSSFFQSWKAAVEAEKKSVLLAEERFQTWQRVRHWLTPIASR